MPASARGLSGASPGARRNWRGVRRADLDDSAEAIRGRGTKQNVRNRFERLDYMADPEAGPEEVCRPQTEYYRDLSKSVVARNDSPDVGMNVSVNPYRGCEHGCVYCYARPYHEYLGMSPGLDFETRILVKEDAPRLLRQAMMSPRWEPETVMLSGATDCYQPVEKRLKLTRQLLEVFRDFRNPVGIVTKNRQVVRDIDLLKDLAQFDCASVVLSITTLDLELNRVLEPRTSSPVQRLEAVRALSAAGIPVGVMVAPVIPGLTEHEIPRILEAAAEAGAHYAGKVLLRLPHAVAPLFEQWLEDHYPERKEKVLNRVRDMRGGELYTSTFGDRMRGSGPFAEQINKVFEVSCRKYGLTQRPGLSTAHFRRPECAGDQMALI